MSGQCQLHVSGGEKNAYKRSGANGSQIGHYDIYNDTEGWYFNASPDGQNGCLVVLVENEGNKERTVGHYRQCRITITAEYIPSAMNIEADRESRQTRDSIVWKV